MPDDDDLEEKTIFSLDAVGNQPASRPSDQVRIPIRDSTLVSQLEYNRSSGSLEVTFADGTIISYPKISEQDFRSFLSAPSKGKFYNRYVRGKWG